VVYDPWQAGSDRVAVFPFRLSYFHDIHFRHFNAATHSRHRLAISLSILATGSLSFLALSSQSAAVFSSSAIVESAGIIFHGWMHYVIIGDAKAKLWKLKLTPTEFSAD